MRILEETKPFSQSLIWSLQREYFKENGIKAWKTGEVPHYITNNPPLAKAYAELVFHFLKDIKRNKVEASETVYLLELGGGTGRLAYHFLTYMNRIYEAASTQCLDFCYILSDLPPKNIEFWRKHPRLQPYIEKGMLDFAVFDVENDTVIHLIHSHKTISTQSLSQPLIVIANYFFDSIPHDLFYFEDGTASECTVHVSNSEDIAEILSPADQLRSLELDYQYNPIELFHYEDKFFNDLLDFYKSHIKCSHVLFPSVGMRCLERLKQLSKDGLFLLTADKGHHLLAELDEQSSPSLVYHGSFSLTVNYHAFRRFCEDQGGQAYVTPHSHQHLNLMGLLMLPNAASYTNTCLAFERFVSGFGPDDFFSLKKHFEHHFHEMKLGQLMSLFRLSGYDAHLFKQCVRHLIQILPNSSPIEKQDMLLIIQSVWNCYYPIGEDQDLAFDIGTLLYQMDYYEEAIVFFVHSLKDYGDAAPTYFNLASCFYMLNSEKAGDCLEMCLELDPDHMEAMALRTAIANVKRG
jgi:hypothetical protein